MELPFAARAEIPTNNLPPSDSQWHKLLDYISCDEEMRTGMFLGSNAKARLEAKWKKVANDVNKLGNAKKTGEKWKEAYDGLKTRAKRAYNQKKAYQAGTGGGLPPELGEMGLSDVYKRAIQLISPLSLTGCLSVPDPLEVQLRAPQPVQQQNLFMHRHQEPQALQPLHQQQQLQAPQHTHQHQQLQLEDPFHHQQQWQVHQPLQQQWQVHQPLQQQLQVQHPMQQQLQVQQPFQQQLQVQQPLQQQSQVQQPMLQPIQQQPMQQQQSQLQQPMQQQPMQQQQSQLQQPMQQQPMQQQQSQLQQPLHQQQVHIQQVSSQHLVPPPFHGTPQSITNNANVFHSPPFSPSPNARKKLNFKAPQSGSFSSSVKNLTNAFGCVELQSPAGFDSYLVEAIQLMSATISSSVDCIESATEEMKVASAAEVSASEKLQGCIASLTCELAKVKVELRSMTAVCGKLTEVLEKSKLHTLEESVLQFSSSVGTLATL